MLLTDFDGSGYRIILENDKKSGRINLRPRNLPEIDKEITIELSDIDSAKNHFCRNCTEEVTLSPLGFVTPTRAIADIINGEPRLLVFYKHRWRCSLGHEEVIIDDPYGKKRCTSEEFDDYIVKEIMCNLELRNSAFKKYGVSTSYVQQLVTSYLNGMRSKIKGVCECDKIILYPFMYHKQKRCCVFGRKHRKSGEEDTPKTELRNTVLLHILPNYDVSEIASFLLEKASYFSDTEVIFCDFNPETYTKLRSLTLDSHIQIIFQLIQAEIDNLAPLPFSKQDDLEAVVDDLDLITKKFLKNFSVANKELFNWWQCLSPQYQKKFQPLWTRIQQCIDGFHFKYSFANKPVKRLLELIECFEADNYSYEIMADRMMFSNPAVRDSFFDDKNLHFAMKMVPDFEFHGYYVDISTLDEIFGTYFANKDRGLPGITENVDFYYIDSQ